MILKELLGPIQMCPGPDGSLWAEFYARPAALVKKAAGTGAGSDGSGGVIALAPSGLSYVGRRRRPRSGLFLQSRYAFGSNEYRFDLRQILSSLQQKSSICQKATYSDLRSLWTIEPSKAELTTKYFTWSYMLVRRRFLCLVRNQRLGSNLSTKRRAPRCCLREFMGSLRRY